MRSIVLAGARSCLIGLLIGGLLSLPAMGATSRAVGMVVVADHAHLGSAGAASGADVFPGDYLDTESGGTLRLKVGAGQMYLLSSSATVLVQEDEKVVAHLQHGTIGFSTRAPTEMAIQTPVGRVTGVDGKQVFGQVSLLAAGKIQISAYEGSLIFEANNGRQKTIGAGETYEALADSAGGGTPQSGVQGGGPGPYGLAAAGAVAVLLACVCYPESNYWTGCFN